jgi:hypothetical protein
MITQWNEAEDRALQGCSLLAQVIYLRGLRRCMDYRSGVAGKPGGMAIGMSELADIARFIPDWGSTKKPWRPGKEEVRAALQELSRAGLIQNRGSNKRDGLIFFLPLATWGQSAQKRNPTGTPQEPRTGEPLGEMPQSPENTGVSGKGNPAGTPQGEEARNPTNRISGYINTPPNARVREAGMPECIPVELWAQYRQERELRTGRPFTLAQTLTLWRMLAEMDREGYDLEKVLRRAIAHGFATFDRRKELRKEGLQARGHPSAQTAQTGGFGSRWRLDEGAALAVGRQLGIEPWPRESWEEFRRRIARAIEAKTREVGGSDVRH